MAQDIDEERKKARTATSGKTAPRSESAVSGPTRKFLVADGHALFDLHRNKKKAGENISLTAEMARFHQSNGSILVEIKDFDDDEDPAGSSEGGSGPSEQTDGPSVSGEPDGSSSEEAGSGSNLDSNGGEHSGGDTLSADGEADNANGRRRR